LKVEDELELRHHPMSASGQNATCGHIQAMSGLTPISDIGRVTSGAIRRNPTIDTFEALGTLPLA
jgi:hypothetical protein